MKGYLLVNNFNKSHVFTFSNVEQILDLLSDSVPELYQFDEDEAFNNNLNYILTDWQIVDLHRLDTQEIDLNNLNQKANCVFDVYAIYKDGVLQKVVLDKDVQHTIKTLKFNKVASEDSLRYVQMTAN